MSRLPPGATWYDTRQVIRNTSITLSSRTRVDGDFGLVLWCQALEGVNQIRRLPPRQVGVGLLERSLRIKRGERWETKRCAKFIDSGIARGTLLHQHDDLAELCVSGQRIAGLLWPKQAGVALGLGQCCPCRHNPLWIRTMSGSDRRNWESLRSRGRLTTAGTRC